MPTEYSTSTKAKATTKLTAKAYPRAQKSQTTSMPGRDQVATYTWLAHSETISESLGTDQEPKQVSLTALIIYEYRINIRTTLEKSRENYGNQQRRNED